MNRRAVALWAGDDVPIDWPTILAVRPAALVVMSPQHLPASITTGEPYSLLRPWVNGTMRSHSPVAWFEQVWNEWYAKGERHFDGLQFLNEPNKEDESGYPKGSREAANAAIAWGLEVAELAREAWPWADIHSPPLSTKVAAPLDFYRWMRPLIEKCDYLNIHHYLDDGRLHQDIHVLYPDMPMVISECGGPGKGTEEYGRALLAYWACLPDYVRWAAPYIWTSPQGVWDDWRLQGTDAARVIARAW